MAARIISAVITFLLFSSVPVHAQNGTEDIYVSSRSAVAPLCTVSGEKIQIIGTGFFVSSQGHFLTCHHLLEPFLTGRGKEQLCVLAEHKASGVKMPQLLKIIRRDEAHDLALLQIESRSAVQWIDVTRNTEIIPGMPIAFVGFPLSAELSVQSPTIHQGLISAIKSVDDPEHGKEFSKIYQIDATAVQGFSGAPVFLSESEKVIGILTGHLDQEQGIAFVVPIEYAANLAA